MSKDERWKSPDAERSTATDIFRCQAHFIRTTGSGDRLTPPTPDSKRARFVSFTSSRTRYVIRASWPLLTFLLRKIYGVSDAKAPSSSPSRGLASFSCDSKQCKLRMADKLDGAGANFRALFYPRACLGKLQDEL